MESQLRSLPCFTQIHSVSSVSSGLSQQSFKINADNKSFFAKTINNNTEIPTTICANQFNLAPKVFYYADNWLISEFVDTDNLALSALNIETKITHAIRLMTKCHQLPTKPIKLITSDIIDALITKAHYSPAQQEILLQFSQLLSASISTPNNAVCCHGDLNFSNILINQAQETWLIDYECACHAPKEYDLAMFIAVNGLAIEKIIMIVEQYEGQSSVTVDLILLNNYLLFSYFINALWYFNTYKDTLDIENKKILLIQAKTQWFRLQSALKASNLPLLSGLSIKLTDILPTFDLSKQT